MAERPTIICVDDERVVLQSLCEQLRRGLGSEFAIESAERGDEALEVFTELTAKRVPVPIVISDHIMPAMSGAELLAEIHQRHAATRKVLLTGQADADAVGRAVNEAALYRFIAKPWHGDDLLLTVKEAIASFFQEQKVAELTQDVLEQSDTLAKLVAGIVHEAATPLGAMCSAATTLKRTVDRIPEAAGEENKLLRLVTAAGQMSDSISQGGERIRELIRNLEAFVHLDETEQRVMDLTQILHDAVLLVRSSLPVEVELTYERGESADIRCHPARLHRTFVHLLQNAAAAIDGRGAIRVVTKRSPGRLRITIADTGSGIPADQIEELFVPRLSGRAESRTRLRLGLASCRNVMRSLRGSIQLESDLSRGTTVTIDLPLAL